MGRQAGYDDANLTICENLYTQPARPTPSPTSPTRTAPRSSPGETCATGSSSLSGARVRASGGQNPYPASYHGRALLRRLLARLHLGDEEGRQRAPRPRVDRAVRGRAPPPPSTWSWPGRADLLRRHRRRDDPPDRLRGGEPGAGADLAAVGLGPCAGRRDGIEGGRLMVGAPSRSRCRTSGSSAMRPPAASTSGRRRGPRTWCRPPTSGRRCGCARRRRTRSGSNFADSAQTAAVSQASGSGYRSAVLADTPFLYWGLGERRASSPIRAETATRGRRSAPGCRVPCPRSPARRPMAP